MELRPGRVGALVDSPDGVLLTGVPPGARVTIEARLGLSDLEWTCTGEYAADQDGTVDTTRHASLGGSYLGIDPFGLFWSADVPRRPDWSMLRPLTVTLRATSDDLVGDTSYPRPLLGDGVTEVAVQEDGVAGRLFLPPGDEERRAVVLLAGSEGGPGMPVMGALIASRGLPVLSLAHWKFPGVPDVLRDIEVEVVGRGCDWVRGMDGVADVPPAVVGISRGGELALLAAALTPDKVGPVISLVGSGVPWGACGEGTDARETAWRFGGEPVAQMAEDEDDPDACLDDTDMVAAAEIPIERANGPVLLLSGEADGFWPSARLSRIAEDRAHREGAGDKVVHVAYPEAGHQVAVPPGFPMPSSIQVDGLTLRPGGSRPRNQAARLDAWRRLLAHVEAPIR